MIKKYFISIILLTVTMFFAAGCAVNRVAKDYGNSARLVKCNQILNPDVAKNLEPVYGFNSHAAEATIIRYQMGFPNRPATPFPITGTLDRYGSPVGPSASPSR